MRSTPASPDSPADAAVLTVSDLNREARRLLESGLPNLWVAGEISNLARPRSGHIYFSLKDANAQIRCAMFRGAQRGLKFTPADGAQVLVSGSVSIYEARGDYQIIVSRMQEAGEGALRRQFDELRARLESEGLFAAELKQTLPPLPLRIGVVTSPTAAALRDILNVLRRRFPVAEVIVYPTHVQGQRAAPEVVAALATANARADCDVIIVARGGGSLEDLWAFNTEEVARAIAASRLPVVAGIGHEVDVTIADLVADVRAPTPSGAAELVAPDAQGLQRLVRQLERRAWLAWRRVQDTAHERWQQLHGRLRRGHPGAVLLQLQQRGDELLRRLQRQVRSRLFDARQRAGALDARLQRTLPTETLRQLDARRQQAAQRLVRAARSRLSQDRQRLTAAARQLNAVSPLATLERGYAIVLHDQQVVQHARQVSPGQQLRIRLGRGELDAEVTGVDPDQSD